MNKVLKTSLSVLLSLFCLGCTEAEMGGCDNASVTFEYSGDGVNDTFRQHIANVTYYIYDASGARVATGKMESAALATSRGFQLRLEAGTYEVVCWGNLEHYCQANHADRRETAKIVNLAHVENADAVNYDPLYYGAATLEVADANKKTDVTVQLHSAHITLWLYTKGTVLLKPDGTPRPPVFHVGGFLSEFDFYGKGGGIPMSFTPEAVYKEEKQICMARCEVPRFTEDTPSLLKVYNSADQQLLEVVEIARFIEDNNIQIKGKEEIEIPIMLDFMGLEVVVRLPTWDEIGAVPEW